MGTGVGATDGASAKGLERGIVVSMGTAAAAGGGAAIKRDTGGGAAAIRRGTSDGLRDGGAPTSGAGAGVGAGSCGVKAAREYGSDSGGGGDTEAGRRGAAVVCGVACVNVAPCTAQEQTDLHSTALHDELGVDAATTSAADI